MKFEVLSEESSIS